MVNIVFLGPPGSGKGTQSSLLSKELGIPKISVGDILRNEIENRSDIGSIVSGYVDSGDLVPDDIVVKIIKSRILERDCENGFILDGFPRILSQAEKLELVLGEIGKEIDLVVNIELSKEVIRKRILGRVSCSRCGRIYNLFYDKPTNEGFCDSCGSSVLNSRNDDKNEASLNNRLNIYDDNIYNLAGFYKKKGLIYSVDGLKPVASVGYDILKLANLVLARLSVM